MIGLAETVQRLSAENMVLKSQTSSEAVRSVTMANEVARLNKPSVFTETEDEFSDRDSALTCFVGTMDGTLVQELNHIVGPWDEANPDRRRWERTSKDTLQYPGTVDDKGTKKDGARSPKKSSQSNAHVERAHQTVKAMVRTMKEVIEDKAKIKPSATEDITAWMIRHAAFLQTRFSVGEDGKAAFKRGHHKDYTSQLLPFGSAVDAKVRDEETERSKFDSRFIPGIWLASATGSDDHIVCTTEGVYTARSVRVQNDQEIWNGDLIKRMRGTVGTSTRGQSRGSLDARGTTPANDRMEHEHKDSQRILGRNGQDRRMCGMRKPRRKEAQCCLFVSTEEWTNKSIPQSEHVRHADNTGQKIAHEASSSSTVHTPSTPLTDNRDIDKQDSIDDSENPGEWTPAKRIRMKSKPMTQPMRPREMPTVLEDMETDELQRMGTGSVASKRQGDQPEELTAKERRVENPAMDDQEPEDASQTKARMDEMLMDQVLAVSCGTSRVCVNEGKYESATIRGFLADLVKKGQAREMKDFDDMKVLEWVKQSTVPRDAKILDCGWAMKTKSPSEVRARVVLKDYAVTKLDDLYVPTPTSMTVRYLLFYAAWFELEVSTSDVRVAFMHAIASEPKYANPPVEQRTAGWLWLIKKAMNGMRTASKDFGDLVAEVMNEIQFERGKQTLRSTKTPNPRPQSYSTLTTQS